MANDPTRPLLRFNQEAPIRRTKGKPRRMPLPPSYTIERQRNELGPKLDTLARALARGDDPLTLRNDPDALAPESLLVFEIKDQALPSFIKAVDAIQGLNLVGEDNLADQEGEKTYLYLLVPTQAALNKLLAHWSLWSKGTALPREGKDWERVFVHLHAIRRWGPRDRITDDDARHIAELADIDGAINVRIEIELVFERDARKAAAERARVEGALHNRGARTVHHARIDAIDYEALLVDLPAAEAKSLVARDATTIAGIPDLLAIRPQSSIDIRVDLDAAAVAPVAPAEPTEPAIAAILDAVPVQNHPVYARHIEVVDPDGLEARSVGIRTHGTAMLSLVVRGDLKRGEPAINHKVVVRPVMIADTPNEQREVFDRSRLLVDDFVRAIRDLKAPPDAAAPGVFVINVSLGDLNRPFSSGRSSPWARALDWLAHEFGLLFIVSAGNAAHVLEVDGLAGEADWIALQGADRTKATLTALHKAMPHRRLLAPAEAVNALTVGAMHHDEINAAPSVGASHDPLPMNGLPTPASRFGPGVANAIKPDLLMPGGRLRVSPLVGRAPVALRMAPESRLGGLQVAGGWIDGLGQLTSDAWSGATSGAAALATRAAHFIHDALQTAYPDSYSPLAPRFKALLVKSLLIHRCRIDRDAEALVREVFGPPGEQQHVKRADNVFRVFGYGLPAIDEVTACLGNRATLWATGSIGEDAGLLFKLPLPACLSGHRGFRRVSVTLTWFTSVAPGRRAYKAERLIIEEPSKSHLKQVVTGATRNQADLNRASRGTVFSRSWDGRTSRNFVNNANLELRVIRKPDGVDDLPLATEFALVATLETEAQIDVYDQILARIALKPQVPVPVALRPQS